MRFKKKGYPEEGELVVCTVKKILYHTVFVNLDEYDNLEGLVHISEVSPGRIRNLRDYVREGKQIVCKVLTVNPSSGAIYLSLRRVSVQLRVKKIEEYRQELKAEKILEFVANKLNQKVDEVFKKVGEKIVAEYGSLNACFQDIAVNGKKVLENLKLPKEYVDEIFAVVKERIKPPVVKINGELVLSSNASNGVEIVKSALKKGLELIKKKNYKVDIRYLSAPNYSVNVEAGDYKTAEKIMDDVTGTIIKEMQKSHGEASFKRLN